MSEHQQQKKKRRPILLYILLGLVGLCATLLTISALSNRFLPTGPEHLDRLTEVDRARIAEAIHLKQTLGDQVWPDWGQTDIPLLVQNAEYAFLYGCPQQPPGWEILGDEEFGGYPVYREAGGNHEAFTELLIGDVWVGSMSTKWELDAFMMSQFREMIPAPINQVVPYRLFILSSEIYIAGLLHETFHAFQAMTARNRFDDAELARQDNERYWAADEAMQDAWSTEINLLIGAVQAKSDDESRDMLGQFLEQRARRRTDANLDSALIEFEHRYEWLEGLAKYVELGIWETAGQTPDYEPLSEIEADPDFQGYCTFNQRWTSEIITMRNMAHDSATTRFYYTGMVQARLLDRHLPSWKERTMQESIWLEDLLAEVATP
ncbi:MAG: hypothetical protein JXB30_08055 [Anaerolineae bacterium]|nr:hypothetical protein [Anaerolineae bacterium]